jgi:hypothetical protein
MIALIYFFFFLVSGFLLAFCPGFEAGSGLAAGSVLAAGSN